MLFEFILGTTNSLEKKDFLEEALLSVENQKFTDYGLAIYIDGGEPLSRKFSCRHRIISSRTRKGLAYGLNRLIETSKASYLVRMDDDDVCMPFRLLELSKAIETLPDSWCMLHTGYETNSGSVRLVAFNHILIRNIICHPTVVFNRDVLNSLELQYDQRMRKSQDYKLWLDIIYANGSIYYCKEQLLYYRCHDAQITKTPELPGRSQIIKLKTRLMLKFICKGEVKSFLLIIVGVVYELLILSERYINRKINPRGGI